MCLAFLEHHPDMICASSRHVWDTVLSTLTRFSKSKLYVFLSIIFLLSLKESLNTNQTVPTIFPPRGSGGGNSWELHPRSRRLAVNP